MKNAPSIWEILFGSLLFVGGIRVGIDFPDIDQRVPFLLHRSLLTHSFLLAWLGYLMLRRATRSSALSYQVPRFFVMGFCLAQPTLSV